MPKIVRKIKEKIGKENVHKTEREKLDERREEILAHGRKFKYPMQFAKHRLVLATIIVGLVAIIAASAYGWFALYKAQNVSDILYRLTNVLPVPVAKVDGENVRYSDYQMIFRSSMMPVEQQNGSSGEDDSEEENIKNYYKRTALTEAEQYAYAQKIGKSLGIKINNEQVEQAFNDHLKIGGLERSEESFLKILKDNFGLTKDEYKRMIYLSLMKVEVSKKIDTTATEKVQAAQKMLAENGGNVHAVAEALAIEYEETGGLVNIMNIDGGRSAKAYNMEVGQISEPFISQNGDYYYIIKSEQKADAEVSYVSLGIKFEQLENDFERLSKEDGKIREYIELKENL